MEVRSHSRLKGLDIVLLTTKGAWWRRTGGTGRREVVEALGIIILLEPVTVPGEILVRG
jgi:hypothetical protein